MFVWVPCGELRQVADDAVIIGMKQVGSIVVNPNSMLVYSVEGVSGDMIPAINKENFLAELR